MHAAPSDPPPAEPDWLYTQHGETYGPVSFAELRAAAHLGFVRPGDRVRRRGQRAWMAAATVPELFPPEILQSDQFSKERKATS